MNGFGVVSVRGICDIAEWAKPISISDTMAITAVEAAARP
jgi:hypothetical protein